MRLLRYAFAEFVQRVPRMAKWSSQIDDVNVQILDLENTEEVPLHTPMSKGPILLMDTATDEHTRAMLVATTATQVDVMNDLEIAFDTTSRERADGALRFFAASLALQSQVSCRLWSPTPYLALEGESAEDRDILLRCLRIRLPAPKAFYPLVGPGLEWPLDLATLLDRRDGVLLLGAAVNAVQGIGKLHELFRLFEHAFASAGGPLINPLHTFLAAHPWDLGYTRLEIEGWVNDLRHPATHADLKRQDRFLVDHDVQQHLVRIEQAAHDVLFNKRHWHSMDAEREERNSFRSAVTGSGALVQTDGARVRTFSGWDLHETFPLRGQLNIPEADSAQWGLKLARWYFTDEERARLQAHGADDL